MWRCFAAITGIILLLVPLAFLVGIEKGRRILTSERSFEGDVSPSSAFCYQSSEIIYEPLVRIDSSQGVSFTTYLWERACDRLRQRDIPVRGSSGIITAIHVRHEDLERAEGILLSDPVMTKHQDSLMFAPKIMGKPLNSLTITTQIKAPCNGAKAEEKLIER